MLASNQAPTQEPSINANDTRVMPDFHSRTKHQQYQRSCPTRLQFKNQASPPTILVSCQTFIQEPSTKNTSYRVQPGSNSRTKHQRQTILVSCQTFSRESITNTNKLSPCEERPHPINQHLENKLNVRVSVRSACMRQILHLTAFSKSPCGQPEHLVAIYETPMCRLIH